MPDRERVIEALEYLISDDCTDTQFDYVEEIQTALALLEEQPQIVRCKDCKYGLTRKSTGKVECMYEKTRIDIDLVLEPDWFCADGEKKDG